jgi:hypothetical protein
MALEPVARRLCSVGLQADIGAARDICVKAGAAKPEIGSSQVLAPIGCR